MKWKIYNEVSGWKLDDEDLTLVNSESDGDKLYIVKLWWGSGYQMDCYNAYAFNEEEALNYVVAYIEKEDPGILEMSDEAAATLRTELADENGLENSLEAEDLPEFQESFMYVDATMEGASDTHYIWAENLQIAEYPKEHDYPMSKGIKKESRKFKESEEGDFNDMEKEFTYLGVTITRYDYESLPLPMAASKCSDRTMQAIAKDIQEDLVALGWSPKEIRKYLSDVDNYDYDQDDTADRIKSDFWEYMEKAAVSRGMKYYEDLDDEDTGY